MFFSKSISRENEQFKEKLEELISDPAVKSNSALSELLSGAVKKCEKNESIRSIASSLDLQIRSHFAENELPKSVKALQLDLAKYTAFGANGIVLK